MRRFWLFHANVDRISAQKDMRALTVSACSQSGPMANEYRQKLIVEVGTIAKMRGRALAAEKAKADEGGIELLRQMAGQTLGSRI
jgi:hypothetical protein